MKVFTMTLGDFEYTSVLPNPEDDSHDDATAVYFPGLSYFLFICFALSMIIIVSNLLVWLLWSWFVCLVLCEWRLLVDWFGCW